MEADKVAPLRGLIQNWKLGKEGNLNESSNHIIQDPVITRHHSELTVGAGSYALCVAGFSSRRFAV